MSRSVHARSRPSTKRSRPSGREHGRADSTAREGSESLGQRGDSKLQRASVVSQFEFWGNQGLSIQIRRGVYVLRLRHATRNPSDPSPLSGLAGGWGVRLGSLILLSNFGQSPHVPYKNALLMITLHYRLTTLHNKSNVGYVVG